MGANLQLYTFNDDKSPADIKEHWRIIQDELESDLEIPLCYSGTVKELSRGVDFKHQVMSNRDEAEDYIADNQEKYGRAMAVKYREPDNTYKWLVGGWCSE